MATGTIRSLKVHIAFSGICAISNVLLNFGMRIVDVRTRWFWNRGNFVNATKSMLDIQPENNSLQTYCAILTRACRTISHIVSFLERFSTFWLDTRPFVCLPQKERWALCRKCLRILFVNSSGQNGSPILCFSECTLFLLLPTVSSLFKKPSLLSLLMAMEDT